MKDPYNPRGGWPDSTPVETRMVELTLLPGTWLFLKVLAEHDDVTVAAVIGRLVNGAIDRGWYTDEPRGDGGHAIGG